MQSDTFQQPGKAIFVTLIPPRHTPDFKGSPVRHQTGTGHLKNDYAQRRYRDEFLIQIEGVKQAFIGPLQFLYALPYACFSRGSTNAVPPPSSGVR